MWNLVRMNSSKLIKLSVVVLAMAFCNPWIQSMKTHTQDTKLVASGTWGGEHIILEVSGKGAEVEFDCAHGKINEPMALNKHGDFDVAGTFSPEHGGPIRQDETENLKPARYSGHVEGDTMNVSVTVGKDETVGTYTLTRGKQTMLRKCR
jgi:hypothetical protein